MTGHFEVVCRRGAGGASYLAGQSVSAPFHLSKPYTDAGVLVANIVSVTPGVLDGDALRIRVEVGEGAALALVSPAATRLHRMRGGSARLEQSFRVASGGFLEVCPETLIPGAGSRFFQETRCEVEEGGALLFFESIAPGRVAAGEAFQFERLGWATRIEYGGRAAVLERADIVPDADRLAPLKALGGYYACAYALGPRWEALEGFACPVVQGVYAGSARLAAGGWAHKALAGDSVGLRRWKQALRAALYLAVSRAAPQIRKP